MWSYRSVRRFVISGIAIIVTVLLLSMASLLFTTKNPFEENIRLQATNISCISGKPVITLSWQQQPDRTVSLQRRMTSFETSNDVKGVIASQLATSTYTDISFDVDYMAGEYYYRGVINENKMPVAFSKVITVSVPLCGTDASSSVDASTTATSTPKTESKTQPKNAPESIPSKPIVPVAQPVSPQPVNQPTSIPVGTTPAATPSTQTHTTFPSWMKWGVYVGWQSDKINAFENLVGKAPQLEAAFSHWGNDDFPTIYNERVRDKGRTLVIFWEAVDYSRPYFNQPEYSFDSVINGSLDEYFTRYARDAKSYGGEIILIPYSEFNGDWYPWAITVEGNTPEKFKAAWIHIRTIFTQAGATNVKFGWAPNGTSVPDTEANNFELYYPGTKYVDVVGVDVFNFNSDWMSFDQMARDTLLKMRKYGKPMYVFSMGAGENAKKASWITDTFTKAFYQYPELKGWIWFNENKEEDWRVNSTQSSLEAFKAVLP